DHPARCCKYQLSKVRKQITTIRSEFTIGFELLQISVIQSSKANHNEFLEACQTAVAVANISYPKFESKSQLCCILLILFLCCCKYQLSKVRKQITTCRTRCFQV